ncbi:hypothetical protein D3C80_1344070 [compost metagenome]
MLERFLLFVLITGHNHTGYPEENDLRSRYQCIGRIVIIQFRIIFFIGIPSEHFHRPQPAAEPGIQYIIVLFQVAAFRFRVVFVVLGKCTGFISRYINISFWCMPCRNAVSPAQLTAYTPVLDIAHPVAVQVFELSRYEFDIIIHHRIQCR